MKYFSFVLLLSTLSFTLKAEETRVFKKVSNKQALVTINTEETGGTQAVIYLDKKENDQFIKMLLNDPTSKLAQLKAEIEQHYCGENSVPEIAWIQGCGTVIITSDTVTSYGRGGWMSGNTTYTYFIGFEMDGTGHFLETTHMMKIAEAVEAQTSPEDEYNGIIEKDLLLEGIYPIPTESSQK